MSSRERSWAWSNQHNGKFWNMFYRLAELEKTVAKLKEELEYLNPPEQAKISLGMRSLFEPGSFLEEWIKPYFLVREEQEATEA